MSYRKPAPDTATVEDLQAELDRLRAKLRKEQRKERRGVIKWCSKHMPELMFGTVMFIIGTAFFMAASSSFERHIAAENHRKQLELESATACLPGWVDREQDDGVWQWEHFGRAICTDGTKHWTKERKP